MTDCEERIKELVAEVEKKYSVKSKHESLWYRFIRGNHDMKVICIDKVQVMKHGQTHYYIYTKVKCSFCSHFKEYFQHQCCQALLNIAYL